VPIKVLHVGIGPIGAGVVRQVAARRGFIIVGAVDVDPAKAGRDLGEVCDVGRKLRVKVTDDLPKTIKAVRPDIAVLCTSSSLKKVVPEFEAVLKLKVPIVSTTGVNPGFLMDALPVALTGVCARVTAIEIDRVQDARIRRLPFQLKIGAGLTRDEFVTRVKDQTVRHVGLAESITMIADALGWKLDRVTDEVHPKMADQAVASDVLSVEAGRVCGLIQDGVGYRRGQPVIKLHMEAYLGAPEAYDAVRVMGDPPLSMKLAGGVHGDIATASIVVNSIPKVLQAQPGLRTMRDVALPSFFPG